MTEPTSPEPRVLTLNQASWLGDLIQGVQQGMKMRYYPRGSEDADHPMMAVLRAFTRDGGGLYPHDADIRDAFVWTSGFTEHWLKVSDLIDALDNALTGVHGTNSPMAMIDKEES